LVTLISCWDDGASIQDNYHADGRVQIATSNLNKGLVQSCWREPMNALEHS
jgi:hypothetical protein